MLKSIVNSAFRHFAARTCVIFDDGEDTVASLTFADVQKVTHHICSCFSQLVPDHPTAGCVPVIGVSLDTNASSILGLYAAVCSAVLLQQAFFVIDPSTQAWTWIESAVRHLRISLIVFDDSSLAKWREHCSIGLQSHPISTIRCGPSPLHLAAVRMDDVSQFARLPASVRQLDLLAYVVQTSGSTGWRKTVFVTEASITANVRDFCSLFSSLEQQCERAAAVIFAASPPTFDPSYVDLFMSMSCGAALLFTPMSLKLRAGELFRLLFSKYRVAFMQVTPSFYKNMATQLQTLMLQDQPDCPLKYLLIGGEIFPNIPRQVLENSRTKIYNVYGVTEMSCWQSVYRVTKSSANVPICRLGCPGLSETSVCLEPGTQQVVVSSATRRCLVLEMNEDDEYVVVGSQDSDEYTVRTGDRATVVNGDEVVLLRRSDDIFKVKGKRTSLSEIETQVAAALGRNCICVRIANDPHAEEEDRLVAFVLDHEAIDGARQICWASKMPSHLIPSEFMAVPMIPMTANGKVDRTRLIALAANSRKQPAQLGDDDDGHFAHLLRALWTKYLSKAPDPDDRWVSCGGDSHLAVLMSQDLQSQLNGPLPSLLVESLLNRTFGEILSALHFAPVSREEPHQFVGSSILDEGLSIQRLRLASRGCALIGAHHLAEGPWAVNWSMDLDKCIDATPLVIMDPDDDDGTVFVGSHSGRFVASRLTDGHLLWSQNLPDRIEASPAASLCGSRIFVGCYDGKMYAFARTSGQVVWVFSTGDMIKALPAVNSSSVIFGSYDKFIYCVNSQNGCLMWKTNIESCCNTTPCFLTSGSEVGVAALNGHFYLLDVNCGRIRSSLNLGAPIFSSPAVLQDRYVLIVTVRGVVRQLERTADEDLSIVWSRDLDGQVFGSVLLLDSRMIVGSHQGVLHGLRVDDGSALWTVHFPAALFATPCLLTDDTVAALSVDGTFQAVQLHHGRVVISTKFPSGSHRRALFFASPVWVGPRNMLLLASRDNLLYSFCPVPRSAE